MRLTSFRTVVAFLVAPWAPAAIMAILVGEYVFSSDWWAIVTIAAAISYVGVIFFGVPVAYFLARRGSLNLIALAIAGTLGGVAVFGVFVVVLDRLFKSEPELLYGVWGAPLGLVAALAFGAIAGVPLRTRNGKT
jgi:hypothetical protein